MTARPPLVVSATGYGATPPGGHRGGECFELDGRLAFVAHRGPPAHHGPHGVEQPAHAGGDGHRRTRTAEDGSPGCRPAGRAGSPTSAATPARRPRPARRPPCATAPGWPQCRQAGRRGPGDRPARSRPGRRRGTRRPTGSRRCRSRDRRRRRRAPARCGRGPPGTRPRGRGGAGRRRPAGRARRRSLVERYSGWRSWATSVRRHAAEAAEVVDGLEERPVGGQVLQVADVVAGHNHGVPWPRPPCSSARHPRPARGRARGRAGRWARGRSPGTAAAPGSAVAGPGRPSRRSGCGWAGRGPTMPSTSGPSRSTASSSVWAMGSSDRLPLVMTSGRPTAGHEQVMQGRVGQHDPQLGQSRSDTGSDATAARPRERARSDAGPSPEPPRPRHRSSSTSPRAMSRSATITANGLSSRAFRRRSSATAAWIGGVHRQVVAADALDGQDGSDERATAACAIDSPPTRGPGRASWASLARGLRRDRTGTAAGRRPGRHWAGRGSGGRRGRRTPAGSPRTW